MFYGTLLTLLTGIIWLVIAIDIMVARRAQCRVEHFYMFSSLGSSALIVLYLLSTGALIPAEWSWLTIACMVVGSLANALANICIMINMGCGGAALYFALSKMGFALSFLWAVLFLGDHITPVNILGMLCLVGAVIFSTFKHTDPNAPKGTYSNKCLFLALLSVACSAATQILFIFPGSKLCNAAPLPPMHKTLLVMLTNIVVFSVVTACRKHASKPRYPLLLGTSLVWAVLAICSYAALFAALRHLGQVGQSGIVYPIGNAVMILGMTVFTRVAYKEKLTRYQQFAIALIIIGICAIKL